MKYQLNTKIYKVGKQIRITIVRSKYLSQSSLYQQLQLLAARIQPEFSYLKNKRSILTLIATVTEIKQLVVM